MKNPLVWWRTLPLERIVRREDYHWLVVGTVCIGAFMAALDASIVNVALPTMGRAFHAGSGIGWVLIAYLLTLASLLTVIGRWADLVGRRPLYTLGFLVFIIGSAACGAAVNLPMLIGARVFQAAGAALLQANSVSIITAAVPSQSRGRAIGIQGSALAVGMSVGPAVGGTLIALFGWQSIFYVNIPVGLAGLLVGALVLPLDRPQRGQATFDWVGSLLFTPFLIGLMMWLEEGERWGWGSFLSVGVFVASVLLLFAFIRWEKKAAAPLIDLRLFKIPVFSIGNASGLLSYAVMFGVLVLMPYYFERVLAFSTAMAGLLLTAVPLGMTLTAPIAGRLADQFGSRFLTVVGMLLAAGSAIFLGLGTGIRTNVLWLIVELFVVGVGLGIFTPPNNSSVMGSLPGDRLGVGGGILNMARSLGMAVGTAISLTLLTVLLSRNGGHAALFGPKSAWILSLRVALWAVAVLGLVAMGLSWLGADRAAVGRRRLFRRSGTNGLQRKSRS